MGLPSFFPNVTITSGQTVSATLDCDGNTLCAVRLPSTFDGTTLLFNASVDGTNFFPVWSGGAAYSVTVAASIYQSLDPSIFAGIRWIQFVAGTSQSTSDTILTAAMRPVG